MIQEWGAHVNIKIISWSVVSDKAGGLRVSHDVFCIVYGSWLYLIRQERYTYNILCVQLQSTFKTYSCKIFLFYHTVLCTTMLQGGPSGVYGFRVSRILLAISWPLMLMGSFISSQSIDMDKIKCSWVFLSVCWEPPTTWLNGADQFKFQQICSRWICFPFDWAMQEQWFTSWLSCVENIENIFSSSGRFT